MAITINTGSDLCKVISYLECPACCERFEATKRPVYVWSNTVGDKVRVCEKHANTEFNACEELNIQNAIDRALRNKKRGYVLDGQQFLRKFTHA
jgi:hypothetical protein